MNYYIVVYIMGIIINTYFNLIGLFTFELISCLSQNVQNKQRRCVIFEFHFVKYAAFVKFAST